MLFIIFSIFLLLFLVVCSLALRNAGRRALPQAGQVNIPVAQAEEARQAVVININEWEHLNNGLKLSPDMVDTYQELGDLFRQKGEIERAVGIRQLIINNSAVDLSDNLKARFAMGLDFRHAGLFNKAIDAFSELLKIDPGHADAGRQLVYLYEEVREWDKAYVARKRVDKVLNKTSPAILAHYKTEQGKEMADINPQLAEASFGEAIRCHRQCLDAYLHLGDLYFKQNRLRKAYRIWRSAVELKPACANLILARLERFNNSEDIEPAIKEIFSTVEDHHPLFLFELAKWELKRQREDDALTLLDKALKQAPGFMAAHDLRGQILLQKADSGPLEDAYRALVLQIKDSGNTSYRCNHCGFTSYFLSWQCPRCRHWDSIDVLTY